MTMAPPSVFLPTLPGRYYTDPAIFEREKREIFEKQWLYACRAQDVRAPGRFVRATVGNENVIVVRDRDRQLRAFLNVCPAPRRHALPDRQWRCRPVDPLPLPTRGPTGSTACLISAPNWQSMAVDDKADYGLHPVTLAEWHGLVWLNLAENPAPLEEQVWRQLDYRLGGDRAKFARYDLAGLVAGKRVDYTVAANWKIIRENFQECYHCATIHPELVDTLPQFRSLAGGVDATYETDGYYFAEDKASFSVSGDTVLPRLPGLEDRDDRRYFGMVIRPNCFLSLLPDHVIVHRFEPVSPELTTVVCEWLFPPKRSPLMTSATPSSCSTGSTSRTSPPRNGASRT